MQFFLPERWGLQTNNNKNAGHDMAIVGEPCNTDTHAKIPALFMSMLCTWLIVTVQLSFFSDRLEHRIHPRDTTHTDTTHTESNVELGFPD